MRAFDDLEFSTMNRRGHRDVDIDFMRWAVDGDMTLTLELSASFRTRKGQVQELTKVKLEGFTEPLTVTEISRFPWSRWLQVARLHAEAGTGLVDENDTAARWGTFVLEAPDTDAGVRANRVTDTAKRAAGLVHPASKRPGRTGHQQHFYEAVASRWLEMVAAGNTAPARTISDEQHVNIHTVNGWIREARRRGLLPPASARQRIAR